MEKRLFLAIALSMLILMAYSSLVHRFSPKQEPALPSTSAPIQPFSGESQIEPVVQQNLNVKTAHQEALVNLANKELELTIDQSGTGIKECKVNPYDMILPQRNIGVLNELQDVKFTRSDVTDGIAISYIDKGKDLEIRKTYRFTKDKYILEMVLEFISLSSKTSYVKYGLNIASIDETVIKRSPEEQRYTELALSFPNNILRKPYLAFKLPVNQEKIQWIGVRDRYFCSIIKPIEKDISLDLVKNIDGSQISYALQSKTIELTAGQKVTHSYYVYLGPQNKEFIKNMGSDCENIINFGTFDWISQILLGMLRFLFKVSKNWGLAIIFFSLLVFSITSPLSIKSFRSMKRMQELQPIMEELKLKYKESPQKLNKEIMQLYRDKKVNPFGGCLPMVLQIPIFFALYQALMRFIELKGASFLWIKNLSEPDRLFVFSKGFPIIGNELNILPIIMMITMLIQQKLSSVQQQGQSAQQQKMMSLVMSLVFGFIFYHMPSGLVLYWTINSLLMLIFQSKIAAAKN